MKTNQPHNQPTPAASSSPYPNDCFEQRYRQYVSKVFRDCLAITKDSASAQHDVQAIFRNHIKQDARWTTESGTNAPAVQPQSNETQPVR